MPNNDHLKSARQMIDDLINDNPDASKQSFHDFIKAKTIARLNPEMVNDVEDDADLDVDNDDLDDDNDNDIDDNEDVDLDTDNDVDDADVDVDDNDGGDDNSDDEN